MRLVSAVSGEKGWTPLRKLLVSIGLLIGKSRTGEILETPAMDRTKERRGGMSIGRLRWIGLATLELMEAVGGK